ncbi:flagellar motor switch protein FliG [Glaciibacter psychrotolerans]|uniref:Flagellar motor switch protein FliG n=1 Tax=Glaciibacter psychrotolerans TaxID=670054 RepID=A0A7Z0EBW4_9MICO|nr:flagellar motor switch protein FliG [Leifsonia psychrotolerans]NYJ18759.1 flagellar motor switch protein FliG [Leifsonia psychrotolerans]
MIDSKSALTGTQKVAVVLMNLESAVAATVMAQFTEAEATDITAEIVRLRRVDADVAENTLAEFNAMVSTGRLAARGGTDFATGLLELSFGAERAAGVMNRVASNMAGKAFEFLDSAEPGQIATLLDGEMAQTIALVVAHLRPAHASAVLGGLHDDLRTDVAQCIATMTSATPESIALVAGSLKSRAAAVVAPQNSFEVVGGVQPLVDIINRADVAMERALLEGLDARDPELAEEIRSRLLTFADIVKLEARDVQNVLRGIDMTILAMAMKGSAENVQQTIRDNLSERNRELLTDELDSMGPSRKSQVEEARAAVVRAIRELEQSGTITVHRSEEDGFVE